MMEYDSLLILSFGGPEKPEDVMPFLEIVLRGRNVPRPRMLEVAEHYYHFGGKSPINDQNRALIAALERELAEHGPHLPIYWGNRNWHPFLGDTLRRMRDEGARRAMAFVTSAYGSYSSCRQYREDIDRARAEVGPDAPVVDKLPAFHSHPGFIETMADRTLEALARLPGGELLFSAHSIPRAMAESSHYEQQLRETCERVAQAVGRSEWRLVYQSRSGPPNQPWLEPDICDYLRQARPKEAIVVPIGFTSDHMEVVYDLDTLARSVCEELGIRMERAPTAGTHPRFVRMIRELVTASEPAVCLPGCCEAPPRPR
jgi:protoporphyrin/coproporphyrin ferrochelatase